VTPFLRKHDCDTSSGPSLARVSALLKERVSRIDELADAAVYFYRRLSPTDALREQHYAEGLGSAVDALVDRLRAVPWERPAIAEAIKTTATERTWKMPKLAMPLRVILTGEAQTPAIDAVVELLGREEVIARIGLERSRMPA